VTTTRKQDAIQFLRDLGADKIPHSGRTLFDHLVGTAVLLEKHSEREAVCLAGMYHSIYGTNFFRHQTLDAGSPADRKIVRGVIGGEAERLVWLFCMARHLAPRGLFVTDYTGDPMFPGSQAEWLDLMAIERANLVEQRPAACASAK
jgi:hypothetical protein